MLLNYDSSNGANMKLCHREMLCISLTFSIHAYSVVQATLKSNFVTAVYSLSHVVTVLM